MFVDLVDHLRCPNPHEEIWLVANAARMIGRDIVDGLLGCPVCRSEFPIRDGIAYFVDPAPDPRAPASAPSAEEAVRLAAFLDLTDPRGYAALVGDWGTHAALVRSLTDTHLVLVNPPAGVGVGSGTSGVVACDVMPFAKGWLCAIAFDESAGPALVASALAAVRGRGRVVAPAHLAVPAGVTELVRDDRVWVGERLTEAPLVPLLRR